MCEKFLTDKARFTVDGENGGLITSQINNILVMEQITSSSWGGSSGGAGRARAMSAGICPRARGCGPQEEVWPQNKQPGAQVLKERFWAGIGLAPRICPAPRDIASVCRECVNHELTA